MIKLLRPDNLKSHPGFTLVEFLLYFAILGILVLAIGAILFNIIWGKVKLETIQETSQNARTITELISDKIRNAQSVTSPAQGASGATLVLAMADSAKNPTTLYVSSGVLRMTEGTGAPVALTSDEVTVSGISFTNVSYPDQPGSVRIQLTVGSSNTSGKREYANQETFYTTVTIRPK